MDQADLGHLCPVEAKRQASGGVHLYFGDAVGAALDEVDQSDRVDHRVGVRHHDEGGDAAGRCCVARCLERLFVLRARLAGLDPQVDQAGRQRLAVGIDLHIGRRGFADASARFHDHAVLDQDAAFRIEPGGGINDARVVDGCASGHRAVAPASGAFFASVSSTAMRTATPISTCSVISERVL